jgi:anti-sigma regulatory factor (Ser/Thr protein kinase)
VNVIVNSLVKEGKLMKVGSTRNAVYMHPAHARAVSTVIKKRFANKGLKEHEVLDALEKRNSLLRSLPENIRSIFTYAFSEMLNNAIEHSSSAHVEVTIEKNKDLTFSINDYGIGVFKNIMHKRHLQSALEAVQDLLKGKTTTAPQAHSGEGIFFTSKIADIFSLESFGYTLTVNNLLKDVFFEETKPAKRGTKVYFQVSSDSAKHLIDVFKQHQSDPEERAFDKTEIKLYAMGTIHISRSQARRVLSGLEKFRLVVLDFDHVPNIGQAFADEVFRVFKNAHPTIALQPINMNEAVQFMVERVGK